MNFLVVGLGSMGKRRVRNLKALGVEDILGFDLREDRRREASDKYGIRVFADFDEALSRVSDAVIISLPPDLHVPFARKAIQAGKHFFTEASVISEGMGDMIREMKERGVIGFPSCTMQFFPGPRRVAERLKEIGRPLTWVYHCGQFLPDWHPWESIKDFYVSKRETGGAREIVPFELGSLTRLFGRISQVSGQVGKVSDLPVDIDDVYQILVKHEAGTVGSLTIDVVARPAVRHLRILGSEGTIEWDNSLKRIRVFRAAVGQWQEESLEAGHAEKGYLSPEEPYIEEMKTFLTCLKARRPPTYTFEDDWAILKILYASEDSSKSGKRTSL